MHETVSETEALCWVYMTAPDAKEAEALAKSLLEAHLVACVNVVTGVRSFYRWEGEIQDSQEVILIAKARKSCMSMLITHVRKQHSYDCPCIVELPIQSGNPDFLNWVVQETHKS